MSIRRLILIGSFLFSYRILFGQAGGESCETATPVCTFPVSSSNFGFSINAPFNICTQQNWVENNLFYSFVAGSTNMTFEVLVSNCWVLDPNVGGGLQGQIYYTEDCIVFEQLSCFTQPFPGFLPVDFQLSFVAEVGVTYLLMIDGYAGDVCDFTINLVEGSLGVPSIASSIQGDYATCTSDNSLYEIPDDFEEYLWTLNPQNGNIIGATNGNTVSIQWTTPGTAELCTHGYHCNSPSPELCQTIEIGMPTESNQEVNLCQGGAVMCAGQEFYSAGTYDVLLLNEAGCDSTVHCKVNLLPVIPPSNLTKTICAPATFTVCGITYTQTGIYSPSCPSFQGCDSTILLDLAILNPLPVIAPPDSLPCEASPLITLNGTASNSNNAPGGFTSYQWTGPGIVGANNGNTVQVNEPGTYCLQLVHGRGTVSCSKTTCLEVVRAGQLPTPTLEGDTIWCTGQTAVFHAMVDSTFHPDGFIWTTQNGTPIDTTTSDSIELEWNAPFQGAICVVVYDECGTSAADCLPIEVVAPDTFTLSGPNMICQGEVASYYLQNSPQYSSCQWSVPLGASFTQSGDTILVDFSNAQSGQVCASCTNECGNIITDCITVNILDFPNTPIQVSGDLLVCPQQTVEYCIAPVQGATQYIWTGPFGTQQSTNTCLSGNWAPSGPGTVCVTASNFCGQSMPACWDYEVAEMPTVQTSGNDSICENSIDIFEVVLYSTGTFPLTMDWSINGIPQTPMEINQSPTSIFLGESQAGTITPTSIVDVNGCVGIVSGSATMTLLEAPSITAAQIDCDSSSSSYTVSFEIIGGDASSYSVVPMNGNLQGGVFTSYPIPVGSGYSFVVQDGNHCGQSVLEDDQVDCNCVSSAGSMVESMITVCGDDVSQVTYDPSHEILDNNDAVCFILHSGDPTSPLATNDSPVFQIDTSIMAYGQTYFICPVVGDNNGLGCVDLNAPCIDYGTCTAVVFRERPKVSLGDTVFGCLGQTVNIPFNYIGQLPFDVTFSTDNGSQFDLFFATPPFQFPWTLNAETSFYPIHLEDEYCQGAYSGSANAIVHTPPVADVLVTICSLDHSEYSVEILVDGGDSTSYTITPNFGNWNGQVYTSLPIQSGSSYDFQLDDGYGCGPNIISGVYNCQCITHAGTMSSSLVTFCEGTTAVVAPTSGQTLESEDILIYVLHDGGANGLGTILQQNSIPSFNFDPANMGYGITYYISALAGDNSGNNTVDLSDPCRNISNGTPIIFHQNTIASIAPPPAINCINPVVTLQGASSQSGSSFLWSVISGGTILGNPNTSDIMVNEAGTYQLMVSAGSCSDISTVVVTDESTSIIANILASPSQTLDCTVEEINLEGFAVGASNLQFEWSGANGIISNLSNISVVEAGSYLFIAYDQVSGCSDTTQINIEDVKDYPILTIDQTPSLNCYLPEAWITGSSQSPNDVFEWITITAGDTTILSNEPALMVSNPGEYWLIGTSANGCSSILPVNIAADFQLPNAIAGPDNSLDCYQTVLLLNGSSNTDNVSFQWSATDPTIIIPDPNVAVLTVDHPSTYVLTVTSPSNGCTSIDSVLVDFDNRLKAGVVEVEQPSCNQPNSGTIIVNMEPIQSELYYSLNDQAETLSNEFTNLFPGNYAIKVTSEDGCIWETNLEIQNMEAPTISLGDDQIVFLGEEASLLADYNIPDNLLDTLIWSPPSLQPCILMPCSTYTIQPTQQTVVSVTLMDVNGCVATDVATIFVKNQNDVYVPNAFSPNGDGINDLFVIYTSDRFKTIKQFLVFDRWGNAVYQTSNISANDFTKGWDGNNRGQASNAGVYTWFAILVLENGEERVVKGDITLVR